MSQRKRIAVIGGGISGLLVAHQLVHRGHYVALYESQARLGGWIRSERKDGVLLEWGPNTLMANGDWFDLFRDLELVPQLPRPSSRRRFIYWNQSLQEVPTNPLRLLTSRLIPARSKFLLLRDLFRKDLLAESDLSLYDFAVRYLDRDIMERLFQPFVNGVYASDVKELSLRACFPKIYRGLQQKGSLIRGLLSQSSGVARPQMVSFPEGLEEIVRALSHRLGARVRLQTPVEKIERSTVSGWDLHTVYGQERFDQLVIASPADKTAWLLKSHLTVESFEFLSRIPYQRIMVWNLICQKTSDFAAGFGCLFPRSLGIPLLGSLWRSEIFEGAAPDGLVSMSQFFAGDEIPEDLHAQENSLRKLIPGMGQTIFSETRVYERGIPKLGLGHAEKMSRLLEELPPGIRLVGNYVSGVGLLAIMETVKTIE